jgi:hypothetical protein
MDMEQNLIAAYKSLALVAADPETPKMGPQALEKVQGMMGEIRSALIQIANRKAVAQVDTALKA